MKLKAWQDDKNASMATTYRCYLLNGERIAAVEGDEDATAVREADRILAASNYKTAEVWDGTRMVSIIGRNANSQGGR
jgi:hypothetical protein